MQNPKISVCIPVFNGADFIKEAIDSVLQQDFNDYELLIIDNCSTDNTVEVIKAIDNSKIKLIQNTENIGLIPNWNKALENAKGDYIKILPADDFIYPGCLKIQSEVLDADINEEISLVCGRRSIINDKGKVLFVRGFTNEKTTVNGTDAINKNILSGGNIIGEGGAIMFRKNIIKKTGVFNSTIFYVLDLDLWYKILLHGNLCALPNTVSAFRISSSSASVHVIDKQYNDVQLFIKQIYSDKNYKVTWINAKIGIFKAYVLTKAKKILYKKLLNKSSLNG